MPVKKATPKKAAPRKAAPQKVESGDTYSCEVCGLAVVIDEDCDCIETCDIICCGEPMKEKKVKVKSAKK